MWTYYIIVDRHGKQRPNIGTMFDKEKAAEIWCDAIGSGVLNPGDRLVARHEEVLMAVSE